MRKWLLLSAVVLPLGLAVAWAQVPGSPKTSPRRKAADLNHGRPQPKHAGPMAVQPAIAKNRVVKVTVYPDSALVTREVQVPAGEGLVELVVSGLPERVQDSSLYCDGADGLRVLSTRYRTRPVFEDTREGVRRLQDEQKKLRLAAQKIQSDITTLHENMKTLGRLETFTEKATVLSAEKGALNGDAAITLAKYVMEQRAEKAKDVVALQQQLDENKEQAGFVEAKLRELTSGGSRVDRDAVIVVDRENGAGGVVRLNYLANEVRWRPQYKLHAGGAKEPVRIDYLASLKQQTGEDWGHVDLTLSTAQPMLNAAPPDLQRLEVTVVARASLPTFARGPRPGLPPGGAGFGGGGFAGRGLNMKDNPYVSSGTAELAQKAQRLRLEAQQNYRKLSDAKAVSQLNAAAAFDQTLDLMKSKEQLVAEARVQPRLPMAGGPNEGPSVAYHVKSRLTVPSRNDDQVIEITKLTLEPKYYYKAVPVLGPHVYRLADLANTSDQVLLPGEATMYQGADFVGRMTMPLVAVGEEFTAGFGVDPQLQVQRQMMDKARTTQGGNQVLTYKYRILVSSYKKEAVKLQVWDRLPHAEMETAGITLLKASPEVSKDALYVRECRPYNLLRWDVDVAPNTSGEKALPIAYEFRLELDRNMAISGLLAR